MGTKVYLANVSQLQYRAKISQAALQSLESKPVPCLFSTCHSLPCRSVPEVRFLGADSVITPLRDSLNTRLSQWDRSRTARVNLEAILGLEFPKPKVSSTLSVYESTCMVLALCCFKSDWDPHRRGLSAVAVSAHEYVIHN
jgi:hypothetical protein